MKTILLYGNCHLSCLGEWLHSHYSDRFTLVDCRDCGVPEFHGTKNLAVWANSVEQQREYYERVHEKIKQVDYFIFQHTVHSVIDELQTEFLVENIAIGKSICIPNPRFLAYPLCNHSCAPFIKHVYHNVSRDKRKILDYLTHVNDPEFHKITFDAYESCMKENIKRCSESAVIYKNSIDTCSFMADHWRQYLIFSTNNHPAGIYWNELVKKLFEYLEEQYDHNMIELLQYPNLKHVVDVMQIAFFRDLFPNIIIHQKPEHRLYLGHYHNPIFFESMSEYA